MMYMNPMFKTFGELLTEAQKIDLLLDNWSKYMLVFHRRQLLNILAWMRDTSKEVNETLKTAVQSFHKMT